MLSHNRINGSSLGLILLLAGCGGAGYGDARLASASAQPIDLPYAEPQRDYAPEQRPYRSEQHSDDPLQGDYPPEPGGPNSDHGASAPSAAPGAGYDRPGTYPASSRAHDRAVRGRRPLPPADRLPMDAPPALAEGTGPRGTSGQTRRYDAVGYAGWNDADMSNASTRTGERFDSSAITATHFTLPIGSVVEVTSLDTGRSILVLVDDRGPEPRDREIDLSRGAAQALGITAIAPVRVRLVTAEPSDMMALRSGRPAAPRIDAPRSLLAALRRKLPARVSGSVPSPRGKRLVPAPQNVAPPRPVQGGAGLYVQIAALSNERRAQALATDLGGRVQRVGSIYRVQIGPFATTASAQRARDGVARRGYGDARIVKAN